MSDDFDLLRGADGPRPLPPHLRDRLETALIGSDLVGVDAPRPLPPHLRRRIERSLVGRRSWTRGVAAAAALLLLVASAVAIGRALSTPDADTFTASRKLSRGSTPVETTPPAAGSRAAGGAATASAAPPERPAPTVSLSRSTVRPGEEVVVRTANFSTPTALYRLHAPSGRVVLEGEGGTELRFAVALREETGQYTLVVHNSDGTEHAEAYLDVVLA